ncbi:MAG: hypothetical protein K6B17_10540 [Treponema sp.]|nr:hypothetical protein [Treponema sp.]
MKKTGSILILAAVLFLFSCASTPEADSKKTEAVSETTVEEAEDKTEEAETPQEEIAETHQEETEVETEEEAEEILEPVESDIIGWYESDPSEVVLSPMNTELPEAIEEKEVKDEVEITKIPVTENEHVLGESKEGKKIAEITASVDEVKNEVADVKKDVVEVKKDVEKIRDDIKEIKTEKEETKTVKAESKLAKAEPKVTVREENAEKKENGTVTALGADIPAETEEKEIVAEPVITPSRKVTMLNNQYLDIEYPGTGWIYLGEKNNSALMRYFGRKLGSENTLFTLRSREEGTTILHFYKNDALTGHYIDDYLEVEVKGINTTTHRVTAPRYADIVPSRPEKKTFINAEEEIKTAKKLEEEKKSAQTKKETEKKQTVKPVPEVKTATTKVPQPQQTEDDNGAKTVIQTTGSNESIQSNVISDDAEVIQPPAQTEENTAAPKTKVQIQNTKDMVADKILELAQEAYNKKEYAASLAYLDEFFEKATTRIDEGLYLQGQNFESASEVRNIKSALETYETIVKKYPQSINWAKANARVTYLKKFYFNIR